MEEREKNSSIPRILKTAMGVLILLAAWQMAASSGIWSAYVLPPPMEGGRGFGEMAESGILFRHILVSGRRVLTGFSFAFVLAMAGGILASQVRSAEEYYDGFLEFMRNVPPISLIALLILWFGIGETSKSSLLFWPPFSHVLKYP